MRRLQGQAGVHTLEYVILVVAVGAAVTGIFLYVRRAFQGNVVAVQEEVSGETQAETTAESTAVSITPKAP